MEIICLEDVAFHTLIENVVDRIKDKIGEKQKWLSTEQAMTRLQIKSKTTLQNLRDEGKIRYSHPQKKWILYDAQSIDDYLERNAKNTFS